MKFRADCNDLYASYVRGVRNRAVGCIKNTKLGAVFNDLYERVSCKSAVAYIKTTKLGAVFNDLYERGISKPTAVVYLKSMKLRAFFNDPYDRGGCYIHDTTYEKGSTNISAVA